MLLYEAWFEAIAATLFAILVYATSYRPPLWFWSGSSHQPDTSSKDPVKSRYQSAQDVPGPFALPILGTRWIFSWFGYYQMNKIHDAYKDLNQRYGPLCKEEALWNWPVISVFSREDIEAVLRRGSRYPLRPPQEIISQYRQTRRDRYTNLGLVNEQGETWQKLRAALTPELMGANTVLGFFPALNQVSDDFINLIRVRRSGDDVTGFEEIAYRMGLESTCTLILGRHLGFLKPHSATSLTTRLAEAVRIHFTASRDAFYGLPLWKILPTLAYRQLIESEDAIYNIISELLETTINEQKEDARDERVEAVFQSILREKNLDMRDKKAAIIDFIAAGIHTLGNTLVFLFYLIGRNSEVQKRLYEETATLAPPGCDIAAEDLRNAKYLRACITEAFRVIPTVPCIARILDESIELSGHNLDAGTVVLLHTWIAGLENENFKDASQWIPERWLKPMAPHSPLLVAPFGFGRRICPGKRFVEQALQLIVAKVVREFEIVSEEEINLQFEYIIAPKGPVSLTFRDRAETV
ncbi:ecdysone 20-monooxygenase isoform X2 [Venturia canescens]|uniref:ecdysone 20-monooxygenase isoform X2 n=2 Tax=Venturia canescens TaxID=32260 RepID=UPI001C9BC67F|nr:ecdysone 20-monooxygenase isoform X2 [Venturia canescens]XP_043277915.1 ecdysone 20-monooxygenase isoform X2 [Venturia canescens]XP_043277916.1 ecdysone 20-monooxygenase isoform X2 [Venturia canescens]XP_043277917.1 ecdysone 20-monooxygenase isoform X2 [Venturia canescens]